MTEPQSGSQGFFFPGPDIFALGVILYELMTDGYHPVGIKLQGFWPCPKDDNSKKLTREDAWRKWVDKGCQIIESSFQFDSKLLTFIQKMISTNPISQPTIDEVIAFLLELIKEKCEMSYEQVIFLITYDDHHVPKESLDETRPYLFKVWKKFEGKFG